MTHKPSNPYAQKMNTNELVQLFFHHMVLKIVTLLEQQYGLWYNKPRIYKVL